MKQVALTMLPQEIESIEGKFICSWLGYFPSLEQHRASPQSYHQQPPSPSRLDLKTVHSDNVIMQDGL